MELNPSSPVARNGHLSSAESFVTEDADTLVIERRPAPEWVGLPQNQQAFI
jgi:hypothetical protein